MAATARGELRDAFRANARRMLFSNDTVDAFLDGATLAEVRAVNGMIEGEMALRERRRRERLVRQARFPSPKTIEGYDFSQVALPEGYGLPELRSLSFLDSAEGFVFHGRTGRGKTHLATAIGMLAVEAGRPVRFFTVAQLVLALSRARREQRLEAAMRDVSRADLLILDEFGYVPIDPDGARLLFQVIDDCYERRSVIIATNIEFSKWGTVLGDDKLAAATIDRIVHHSRLVEFNGTSRRMDEALMLGRG